MILTLPPEIWIKIALAADQHTDEYVFNALVRAIPSLGRWTIYGNLGDIIGRKYDLMEIFGYTVRFNVYLPDYINLADTIEWRKYKNIHRNDTAAMAAANDKFIWCKHTKFHRVDGPARIFLKEQFMEWSWNGVLHRIDGPARIRPGKQDWYKNGVLHRDSADDSESCGPAVLRPNRYEWYRDGMRHRDYGPAIVRLNGEQEWWTDGIRTR